jgi:hypothetical protein
MGRLVHTGLGSSSLVAHVLQYPPPRKQLCTRSCSNKHTHTHTRTGSVPSSRATGTARPEKIQLPIAEQIFFLVILLPAVEKRHSGKAEVAGTANTQRARPVRKGHNCFDSHLFHSIRGLSVLCRGTAHNFHNPISLSVISSAVTSKLTMAIAVTH